MLMRGETLTIRILYLLDIKKEAFALSCNYLLISHFCDLCSQTYKHRNLKQAFLDNEVNTARAENSPMSVLN